MNISTDPRLMKQLLLSQWTSGVNPLAAGSSSAAEASEGAGLFDLLLSQLIGSSGSLPHSPVIEPSESVALPVFSSLTPSYSSSPVRATMPADNGSLSAYDSLIADAASKYGVDPALIKGVIQQESSFNSDAVSKSGAKGLMQLMDATARGLGVKNSFDPAQNIDGGTRFLSYLLRKYDNNVSVALAAYNAGPGRIDRLGIATDQDIAAKFHTLPHETQNYIGKVLEASKRWSIPA